MIWALGEDLLPLLLDEVAGEEAELGIFLFLHHHHLEEGKFHTYIINRKEAIHRGAERVGFWCVRCEQAEITIHTIVAEI